MIVKCIVATRNSFGEPDLFFVKVSCSETQYNEGWHYEAAKEKAEDEGYESYLVYDENDSAGKAMLVLFAWDTASIVKVSEKKIKAWLTKENK